MPISVGRKSEKLLEEVVHEHPDLFGISYFLELLQAELGNYEAGLKSLGHAADGM